MGLGQIFLTRVGSGIILSLPVESSVFNIYPVGSKRIYFDRVKKYLGLEPGHPLIYYGLEVWVRSQSISDFL